MEIFIFLRPKKRKINKENRVKCYLYMNEGLVSYHHHQQDESSLSGFRPSFSRECSIAGRNATIHRFAIGIFPSLSDKRGTTRRDRFSSQACGLCWRFERATVHFWVESTFWTLKDCFLCRFVPVAHSSWWDECLASAELRLDLPRGLVDGHRQTTNDSQLIKLFEQMTNFLTFTLAGRGSVFSTTCSSTIVAGFALFSWFTGWSVLVGGTLSSLCFVFEATVCASNSRCTLSVLGPACGGTSLTIRGLFSYFISFFKSKSQMWIGIRLKI